MKQKIVVRVPAMHDNDTCRIKALQAVVVNSGVELVTIEGAEMLVVIGQRINTSKLIRRLEKKNLGEVELLIDGVTGEEPPALPEGQYGHQPSGCKPCTIM